MPSLIADELIRLSQPALKDVHPLLAERVSDLIVILSDEANLYFGAHMGYRSYDVQAALFAQGRIPVAEVNHLRQFAGMPSISAQEAAKKVTKARAGSSWHNFGLAVDIVQDGDPNKAGIQWSWADTKAYVKIGQYAKRMGLAWGGFWKAFKDYPHVELTADLTLDVARKMYAPNVANIGIKTIWKYVDRYYTV